MSDWEVIKCPDGHYRRVIYDLGPFIADYPEQVWLAAIVQGWCPKYVHFCYVNCLDTAQRGEVTYALVKQCAYHCRTDATLRPITWIKTILCRDPIGVPIYLSNVLILVFFGQSMAYARIM